MTTPQKSYRDLVEGEVIRRVDQYIDVSKWLPACSIGDVYNAGYFRMRRPIHRQPDGSWRDEGEKCTKYCIRELKERLMVSFQKTPLGHSITDEMAKEAFKYFNIPLEPEQEEWEKAFDDYIQQMSQESVLPQDRCSKENFKVWYEFFQRQAHERKQGGME